MAGRAMRKDILRCSLVAILLIVGSVDAWAQSAARQSDALLDVLLWGTDRGIDITAVVLVFANDLPTRLRERRAEVHTYFNTR
jgi:hypothetical protein